jgi:thiol-disulfide isomerase/thioredoxin
LGCGWGCVIKTALRKAAAVIATAPNITLTSIPTELCKPATRRILRAKQPWLRAAIFRWNRCAAKWPSSIFFASWCTTCEFGNIPTACTIRQQFPEVAIVGVAYRDTDDRIASYLARLGNPDSTVVIDSHGQGGFALGSERARNLRHQPQWGH